LLLAPSNKAIKDLV